MIPSILSIRSNARLRLGTELILDPRLQLVSALSGRRLPYAALWNGLRSAAGAAPARLNGAGGGTGATGSFLPPATSTRGHDHLTSSPPPKTLRPASAERRSESSGKRKWWSCPSNVRSRRRPLASGDTP